jgi:prepilin-type N-terminal cleavage/methylation domain-containing protein
MRFVKRKKGFTLVEVIVVAVIVAVLAAIAIPLYLSYVENSRSNAAENTASSATSFCAACINSAGAVTATATTITCSSNTTRYDIPAKITLTVTGTTTPGTVSAQHKDGGSASSTYHF